MPALHTISIALRATALISAACVVTAMVADALRRSPGAWLVGLAVSHTVHLAFIVARVVTTGVWMPWYAIAGNAVFGGTAYIFIYWMAWRRRLDTRWTKVGIWWVWAILFLGYAPKAVATPWRGTVALALLSAAVFREIRRRVNQQPAASG